MHDNDLRRSTHIYIWSFYYFLSTTERNYFCCFKITAKPNTNEVVVFLATKKSNFSKQKFFLLLLSHRLTFFLVRNFKGFLKINLPNKVINLFDSDWKFYNWNENVEDRNFVFVYEFKWDK